jgi:hypothetical protein
MSSESENHAIALAQLIVTDETPCAGMAKRMDLYTTSI